MAFRKADLLLPLCLVSAILLNVYAAVDPTGVYQRYLEKLAPMTPPVAAMATALADGVYPWSTQQGNGPAPQPTPQPRPEPTPEPEPAPVPEPEPAPVPEPEPEPQPQPEPGPAPVPEPDSRFTQVDASYFDDAVFIGDSHTDGFMDYAGLPNARNAELQKLADGVNVFFIDCNPIFDDAGGALRADYSGDGVHVKAAYYPLWRDYLFRFGVVR